MKPRWALKINYIKKLFEEIQYEDCNVVLKDDLAEKRLPRLLKNSFRGHRSINTRGDYIVLYLLNIRFL